jgi:hypothetical protein
MMLEMKHKARLRLLRWALRSVEFPLRLASALTWRLEIIRARLQTKIALQEAPPRGTNDAVN